MRYKNDWYAVNQKWIRQLGEVIRIMKRTEMNWIVGKYCQWSKSITKPLIYWMLTIIKACHDRKGTAQSMCLLMRNVSMWSGICDLEMNQIYLEERRTNPLKAVSVIFIRRLARLWVRIPCGALRPLSLKVRTQVSVSLRSSQDRRPPDVLRPFKAGILGSSPIGVTVAIV